MLKKEGVIFDETKSKNKGGRIVDECFFDVAKTSAKLSYR